MVNHTDYRNVNLGKTLYVAATTVHNTQVGENGLTTLIFTLRDGVGALAKVLKFFQEQQINLTHIESRSSKTSPDNYEFLIVFDGKHDASKVIERLKEQTLDLTLITRGMECKDSAVPWFPRRIRDLDTFVDNILMCGAELDADHPGFRDQEYRVRRKYFADLAKDYRHGQPIERVEYTQVEIDTWRKIYDKVVPLYKRYACKEYNHIFPLMEENCHYSRDTIPQLEEVSNFLKDHTGFTLRPVAGLLSSRDFLAGLAYRVFHSTQYIRHHANPDYTPEPDICHELLGHAPLFANPDFARFSQEIGLASLGAPDEYIEKLATCYWFTIEFGLCKQDGQIKAYGAGLLSSFGELEYSMSGQPKILPFDPEVTGRQKYPITTYQPVYFLAESFADAQAKLHDYALSIPRPAVFRYNPYTQSVETLNSRAQAWSLAKEIKSEMALVVDSLDPKNKSQD